MGEIHKQQDIADSMKLPRSTVSNAMHGRARLSFDNFLRRFARAYPRISADWLLTGEGAMTLPDTRTQRPHYHGHVAAGAFVEAPQTATADTWHDVLAIAPAYDFTATATGDSMLPLIHDRDTLYCRRLYRGDPLRSGAVYIFATTAGTLVKQLLLPSDRTDTPEDTPEDMTEDIPSSETLTLHSLNPEYDDIELPRSELIGIAKVVATFHPFGADLAGPAPGLRPGSPSAPDTVRPDRTSPTITNAPE